MKELDLSENVTNMFNMFDEYQLESLDLSNFNTEKVIEMGKCFFVVNHYKNWI